MHRQRLFVLTDMSDEEPDDIQSLVRLLLYSCDIELEGLIATTSQWKAIHGSGFRPDHIETVVDAYAQVEDNLRRHRPGYPSADALRALIATGNGNDMAAVGDAHESEGSRRLVERILNEDPRPLWVAVWGGASTLAQALWTLRATVSPGRLARCLDRLWIFEIQGQDDAGAWIAATFPAVHFVRCQYAWRGISTHIRGEWFESRGDHEDLVTRDWFRQHIQTGHGPLGAAYPDACYLHEGDTPSFLHLVPTGLNEPCEIHQGGWGGRYQATKTPWVWSGGCPVSDEGRFGVFSMHTDSADRCVWQHWGKRATRSVYNPVLRWREAVQHDFAARMDWCLCSVADANHHPDVVVNGSHGFGALHMTLARGEAIVLDTAGTSDPDGDSLRFRWWQYHEPGTPGTDLKLNDDHAEVVRVHAPESTQAGVAHLILEVIDDGDPPLRSYRRMVFTVT